MRVQMKCSCGWAFLAEAGPVGGMVQCPDCGKTLAAPVASDLTAEPAPAALAEDSSQPQAPYVSQMPQPPAAPPPVWQAGGAPWASPGAYVATPKPPVGLAITSMVCGIVSLVTGCPCCMMMPLGTLVGTVAVILGAISLAKKRAGRGMAISGVVTGGIGIVISLVLFSVMFVSASSTGPAPGPPLPGPTALPTASTNGDSDPNQAPVVMTGDEVTEALTGPLDMPPNAAKASIELRKALRSYPRRQSPLQLYECVQQFRRYLAQASLSVPDDAEHARMFHTAGDELIDRVLADYRQAGQFAQDGDWVQAEKAYGKMLEYLPDSSNPLARNVRSQRKWCHYRLHNPEDEKNGSIPDTF